MQPFTCWRIFSQSGLNVAISPIVMLHVSSETCKKATYFWDLWDFWDQDLVITFIFLWFICKGNFKTARGYVIFSPIIYLLIDYDLFTVPTRCLEIICLFNTWVRLTRTLETKAFVLCTHGSMFARIAE